jgi:rubrerythrin
MSFIEILQGAWQSLLNGFQSDQQPELLEILRETYSEEVNSVAQYTQYARSMSYPHFRERLLVLAEQKREHLQWLQKKIRDLGGELPQVTRSFEMGKNGWDCLRIAIETAQRCHAVLRQRIQFAEQNNPEIADGLRRIRSAKQQFSTELTEMWLKSFPYAIQSSTTPEEEKQKHHWLAQQKMAWLDHKRAAWEAEGKQVPWAEWIGERELEWLVNQLPTHELAWVKRLAEQETTTRV